MVRLFTAITTAGVLGIPIVGRLMDRCGFVATAAVTVALGCVYGLCVLTPGSEWRLVLGFVAYALFRSFLFTFFFAELADSLGFKYFGVLAGVSFLIAGVAGLLQSPLMEWGAGDCHLTRDPVPGCFQGNWRSINLTQLLCLAALFAIPLLDWRAKGRSADADDAAAQAAPAASARRSPYATASGIKQQPAKYYGSGSGGSAGSLGALREDAAAGGGGRRGGNVV